MEDVTCRLFLFFFTLLTHIYHLKMPFTSLTKNRTFVPF